MVVVSFVLCSLHVVLFVINVTCELSIKSYIESKPLGLHSLLDQVIQHFLNFHILCNGLNTFLMGVCEPLGPLHPLLAIIISWFTCFVGLFFMFSVLGVLSIRFVTLGQLYSLYNCIAALGVAIK